MLSGLNLLSPLSIIQLARSPAARKRPRRDLITRSIYANAYKAGTANSSHLLSSPSSFGKGLSIIIGERLPRTKIKGHSAPGNTEANLYCWVKPCTELSKKSVSQIPWLASWNFLPQCVLCGAELVSPLHTPNLMKHILHNSVILPNCIRPNSEANLQGSEERGRRGGGVVGKNASLQYRVAYHFIWSTTNYSFPMIT